MEILVFWKEWKILEVEKINDKYFSHIIPKNYEEAREDGFATIFLDDIKVVDETLPRIIQTRLPKKESLYNNLNKENDIEDEIIEYINRTKCKRQTDYITIEIEK